MHIHLKSLGFETYFELAEIAMIAARVQGPFVHFGPGSLDIAAQLGEQPLVLHRMALWNL